jgi:hypothetical protein
MALLEEGNFIECKNKYISMVMDLSSKYAYKALGSNR